MSGALSRIASALRPNAGSPRASRMSRVMPTRYFVVMSRLQQFEAVRERALQQQLIDTVGEAAEAVRLVFARPGVVGREERRGLAVRFARGDDLLHAG